MASKTTKNTTFFSIKKISINSLKDCRKYSIKRANYRPFRKINPQTTCRKNNFTNCLNTPYILFQRYIFFLHRLDSANALAFSFWRNLLKIDVLSPMALPALGWSAKICASMGARNALTAKNQFTQSCRQCIACIYGSTQCIDGKIE